MHGILAIAFSYDHLFDVICKPDDPAVVGMIMIFATYPLDTDGPAVSVDSEGEVAVSTPDAAGPSVSVKPYGWAASRVLPELEAGAFEKS